MIESPLITELLAKRMQEDILLVLKVRFGRVPSELVKQMQAILAKKRLNQLIQYAAACPDLSAFREHLLS